MVAEAAVHDIVVAVRRDRSGCDISFGGSTCVE